MTEHDKQQVRDLCAWFEQRIQEHDRVHREVRKQLEWRVEFWKKACRQWHLIAVSVTAMAVAAIAGLLCALLTG